ncbi:MAG: hypothetical protein QM752_06495 [Gammaproteobacteria bacterium]
MLDSNHKQLYFLRTAHGEEIDVVIDQFHTKQWVEIKASHTFKPSMLAPIKKWLGADDQGFLLYQGEEFLLDPQIQVMNYQEYLLK